MARTVRLRRHTPSFLTWVHMLDGGCDMENAVSPTLISWKPPNRDSANQYILNSLLVVWGYLYLHSNGWARRCEETSQMQKLVLSIHMPFLRVAAWLSTISIPMVGCLLEVSPFRVCLKMTVSGVNRPFKIPTSPRLNNLLMCDHPSGPCQFLTDAVFWHTKQPVVAGRVGEFQDAFSTLSACWIVAHSNSRGALLPRPFEFSDCPCTKINLEKNVLAPYTKLF